MRYLHIAAVLALAACDTQSTPPSSSSTASAPAASSAPATSATAAPASPKQARVAALETLRAFVGAASDKHVKLEGHEIYDEKTDPNKLLGRPGQYLAKMSWKVDGQSATIEVFATAEGAKGRAGYIDELGKKSPMLLEYVFVHPKRHAVLRVPKGLTPEQAKAWEAILLSI